MKISSYGVAIKLNIERGYRNTSHTPVLLARPIPKYQPSFGPLSWDPSV